jgi:hypothetical protein
MDKSKRLTRDFKRLAKQQIKHLATTKGSSPRYLKQVSWLIETIAIGCTDVAIGIVLIVALTGMKMYAVWPILVGGGAWQFSRYLFLKACPIILELTIPLVVIINALLVAMVVVIDTAIVALDAIFTVVNDVIDVVNIIAGHKIISFRFTLQKWIKIPQITYAEFRDAISALPPTCAKFDNMEKIVLFFMRLGLHDYTCPTTRVLWPLPLVFAIVNELLSPFFFGSAAPNPHKNDMNCEDGGNANVYDFICAGLGGGYVMTEFFFPSIVMFIVISVIGAGIWRLFKASLYSLYLGLEILVSVLVLFLDIVTF